MYLKGGTFGSFPQGIEEPSSAHQHLQVPGLRKLLKRLVWVICKRFERKVPTN